MLDVLLNRTSPNLKGTSKGRVLAHGMGGLGKTTLSASIVRLEEVREHFGRIAFVSAGQEPAMLELQRAMHLQLVGQPMEETDSGTSESQRGTLETAAAGKRWLVVLDDIWQVEHEQALNFVDNGASPHCKVFVTTRMYFGVVCVNVDVTPVHCEAMLGTFDGLHFELLYTFLACLYTGWGDLDS